MKTIRIFLGHFTMALAVLLCGKATGQVFFNGCGWHNLNFALEPWAVDQLVFGESQSENLWQFGYANKTCFNTLSENFTVLVTDTVNSLPNNSSSSFTLLTSSQNFSPGAPDNYPYTLQGFYRLDLDSLTDVVKWEYSCDGGTNWYDLLTENYFGPESAYYNIGQFEGDFFWEETDDGGWLMPCFAAPYLPKVTGKTPGWEAFRIALSIETNVNPNIIPCAAGGYPFDISIRCTVETGESAMERDGMMIALLNATDLWSGINEVESEMGRFYFEENQLRVELTGNSEYRLRVFNLLGKEMLTTGTLPTGSHSFPFIYPGGIYYYSIQSGDGRAVQSGKIFKEFR